MIIRPATQNDASAIAGIYAPYVRETAITFEVNPPTISEIAERIFLTQQTHPYLVAEMDGEVIGYAYAHTYYARAAYDWTAELSIYIAQEKRSAGIGSALYDALEEELEKRGFVNFLVCISVPNEASINFHKKRGYKQVAHFDRIGYKFERWHDIVWLQKRVE